LSPHPWAGLPVTIRLTASDALNQLSESAPVEMNLPERNFTHPIARAVIDQRKELVKDPQSRLAVAEILGDLNTRPALYRDDTVVFLSLRLAQQRLRASTTTRKQSLPSCNCCGTPRCASKTATCRWPSAICAASSRNCRMRWPRGRPMRKSSG
jgi:hypothetical protein